MSQNQTKFCHFTKINERGGIEAVTRERYLGVINLIKMFIENLQ